MAMLAIIASTAEALSFFTSCFVCWLISER
jgi:hypothetical protein